MDKLFQVRTLPLRGRGIFAVQSFSMGATLWKEPAFVGTTTANSATVLGRNRSSTAATSLCSYCVLPKRICKCSSDDGLYREDRDRFLGRLQSFLSTKQRFRIGDATEQWCAKTKRQYPILAKKLAIKTAIQALAIITSHNGTDLSDAWTRIEASSLVHAQVSDLQRKEFADDHRRMLADLIPASRTIDCRNLSDNVLSLDWYCAVMTMLNLNGIGGGTTNFGKALFIWTSLMNHSCLPNACLAFTAGEGALVTVRAIRDIQPEDEVTVDYLQSIELLDQQVHESRRDYLHRNYGIECQECSETCICES